jgi:RNA-directed DNA polymerase
VVNKKESGSASTSSSSPLVERKYSNLIVLHEAVHRLVHLKETDKIKSVINALQLNNKQKEKVNELRKQCKNDTI